MQALGVLLLTAAIWVVYCGFNGLDVLKVAGEILAKPGQATEIIDKAKKAAQEDIKAKSSNAGAAAVGQAIQDAIRGWTGILVYLSKFKITDNFESHKARGTSAGGVDFAMPSGTPLPAPFSGVATYEETSGGLGNVLTITATSGFKSQYAHVQKAAVVSGTKVLAGQIVAWSGGGKGDPNPGDSTGSHLHWHIINPQGTRIDPIGFMKTILLPNQQIP